MAHDNDNYPDSFYGNIIPLTGDIARRVQLIGTGSIIIEDISTSDEFKFRFSASGGSSISGTANTIPKFSSASAIGDSTLKTNTAGNLFAINSTINTSWLSTSTVVDFGDFGSLICKTGADTASSRNVMLSRNIYFDSNDSLWKYKTSTALTYSAYEQTPFGHVWYWYDDQTGPGTAGSPTLSSGGAGTLQTKMYLSSDGLTINGGNEPYALFVNSSLGTVISSPTIDTGARLEFRPNTFASQNKALIVGCITNGGNTDAKFYTTNAVPIIIAANSGAPTTSTGMYITTSNEVWIKNETDQGSYNLQVGGTGVWAAGAYMNGSDLNLKENVLDIPSTLDLVKKLKPKSFTYKTSYSTDRSTQTGFIAQDLEEVFEQESYLDGLVNNKGQYLSVAYQNLIPILTKAIQEQEEKIEQLQLEIQMLKNK